jgi:hypothetical protein
MALCLESLKTMSTSKLIFVSAVFLGAATGAPLFVVVPNAETNTTGNDNSGSLSLGTVDLHLQEVYGISQFSSIPGDLLISQFAWRSKPGTGPIDISYTSATIQMAVTRYAPNANGSNTLITPSFATNLGSNPTLVLSSGPGTLSSPGCTGQGPCPFDLVINLSTPFLYNPSQGFLLIDSQINGFSEVGTGEFDVESFSPPGGPIADVFSLTPGATTGTVELSDNVTQIGYTLVTPEPASLVLTLFGIGALAMLQRRRPSPK